MFMYLDIVEGDDDWLCLWGLISNKYYADGVLVIISNYYGNLVDMQQQGIGRWVGNVDKLKQDLFVYFRLFLF